MLTSDGLSLIIAMCTCCGHDSSRLRRFRTHARTFTRRFFRFTNARVSRERERERERERSSAWSRSWSRPLVSEFHLLCVATRGTRCMFQSPTRCAASKSPINTTPNSGSPVPPEPVYRVDRRENACAAGREVAILDSPRHTSLL